MIEQEVKRGRERQEYEEEVKRGREREEEEEREEGGSKESERLRNGTEKRGGRQGREFMCAEKSVLG